MPDEAAPFRPGQSVIVTHQIAQREQVWTTKVTGKVRSYEQRETGSWFAHARNHRLWLDRLTLEKADGEIVVLNLDGNVHVEVLPESVDNEPGEPDSTPSDPSEDADPEEPEKDGEKHG